MRVFRSVYKGFLLGSVALGALVNTAFAQEVVEVRTWQHSDFARLVFDWPAAVGYSASIDGQVLSIRFDRPLSVDLGPVRERLQDYVSQANLGPAGQTLELRLTGPMVLSDFTNENSIVVDLRQSATVPAQADASDVQSPAEQPAVTSEAPAEAIALGVRVGEHPNYTRIVFDWPVSTPYSISRDGRAVTLEFSRPATINTAALNEALPAGVRLAASVPDAESTRVTFAVPEEAELRDFPLDQKVVLDVLADAATRNTAGAPLDPSQLPRVQTAEATPPPTEPGPTVEEPDPAAVEAAPSEPEPVSEEASAEEPEPDPVPTQEELEREEDQALADAIDQGTIQFRDGLTPDLDLEPDPTTETEAEVETGRDPVPAPEAVPDQVAETAADSSGETPASAEPDGPVLFQYGFPFAEEVGAAVFRRADNIWIVFDQARSWELAELRATGEAVVERLDQLPVNRATVLRAQVPDRRVNARVRREGFTWFVDFLVGGQKPYVQLPILADVTPEVGPHLILPSDTPGSKINVPDPEMGDVLSIATFLEPGSGIDGLRRYPEFELLPTAQGLAMVRLSDTVLLDRNFDGFQISDPDGLVISAVSPEAPVASGQILSARRLFDLAGLMRGDQSQFSTHHQAIFRSLAEVPDEKLDEARLDFAGFLMAHDRGQEALGVLRVVEKENPQLMARPENLALKAAASVLAGRTEDALTFLNDPRLDGFAESAIWRGAALTLDGEYKAASEMFGPGDSLLARYPYPLKAKLALLRIQTAFANKETPVAKAWIEALEQDRSELSRTQAAALDYQRGRLAVADLEFDLADEIFLEVMESGDRKYAYRGELAWIKLGLKQDFIDDEEALERLERLRYAWRGDRSELILLRDLGELYLKQPDYFEGLSVYRTAVQYFPGDPVADRLAGEMGDIFRQLFLEGEVDTLPPLRAIALYEEFKELTPGGVIGDQLVENIADRLAAIDLMKEAAVKLEELLADENRLPPGEERIRLSSKLALIYLLDEEPQKAKDTLDANGGSLDFFDFDPELRLDRDRLRARAQFQLGLPDEAITDLAGDVSVEADMLRRDIYRETENWQEAAKVLQRLAGNPPLDPAAGVDDQTGRYVINWAVALFQNDDSDGLRDLVDLWAPTMANSALSGVFDFITEQDRAPTGGDVLQTVDQLIGEDRFDNFLSTYRDRLFATPDENPADIPAQPIAG